MAQANTQRKGERWALFAVVLVGAITALLIKISGLLEPRPEVLAEPPVLTAPQTAPLDSMAEAAPPAEPLMAAPSELADADVVEELPFTTGPAPEPTTESAPTVVAASSDSDAAETPVPPQFDVVRVEDDGAALIAGEAGSAGTVYLMVNGNRVEDTATTAGPGEAFVIFTTLLPSPDARVLKLETETADAGAVQSLDQVLLAPKPVVPLVAQTPPQPEAEPVPEVDTAAAPGVVETPEPVAPDPVEPEQTEQAAAHSAPAAPLPVPEQQTVILTDADGTARVLGPPVLAVALDTIQYDLAGEVEVGGRAVGDGFIRVYLDNMPITTSRIEGGGFWNIALPNIETGTYTLRVDELDQDGIVTSRVETPFMRESPELLSSYLEPGSAFHVKAMTIQPGATLWAVAEAKYGDGTQFMKVFEANRSAISDPDLIFPGQVFDLPD